MDRNHELPADHAFVVQFRARATRSPVHSQGRVEHLVSGQATHFDSLEQLLRFIEQTLGRIPPGPR